MNLSRSYADQSQLVDFASREQVGTRDGNDFRESEDLLRRIRNFVDRMDIKRESRDEIGQGKASS